MSEDASLELQIAVIAVLKRNSVVKSIVDSRVFDRVPATNGKVTATFPYISMGPDQEIPEKWEGIRSSEFVLQIDAWSQEPGFPEVKKLARAIEDALNEVELDLASNAQVYFEYDGRRTFRDPDGLTSHAALSFRVGVDKP